MRWIAWGAGVLVVLGMTLFSLPYIVRDQVVIWLRQQGVEHARLTALTVDWRNADVRLHGLRAERDGHYPLNIDHLRVDLDYGALFDRHLKLQRVSLSGLESGLRYADGSQWLGPLNLSALMNTDAAPADADSEAGDSRWSVGLDRLQLADIDWHVALPGQQHRLELEQLDLSAIYLWQPDIETALTLKGRVNGAPFSIESTAVPLPQQKRAQLSLTIEQLPLQSLTAAFLPSLTGTLSTDMTLVAQLDADQLSLRPSGQIAVTDFAFAPGATALQIGAIDWQGAVDLQLEQLQPTQLSVDGTLALPRGVALAQDDLKLVLAQVDWQGRNAIAFGAEGSQLTSTGTLALAGAELDQAARSLALQSARWQGDLQLALPSAAPLALDLDGALTAGSFRLSQQGAAPVTLALERADWQGQLALELDDAGGVGLIDGRHRLALSALSLAQGAGREAALAAVELAGSVRGEALNRWRFGDLTLALTGVDLNQPELALTLQQLTAEASGEYDIGAARLALTSPGVTLADADLRVAGAPLAAFESLRLQSLSAGWPLQGSLADARLTGLRLTPGQADEAMLELADARLSRLSMAPTQLAIDSLELTDLGGRLLLDETMQPVDVAALQAQLAALQPAAAADAATPAQAGTEQREPFAVQIGRIAVAGENSRIDFIDRSTEPDFNATLTLRTAQLTDLDTRGAAQSRFSLQAGINRFASLTAEGAVNLLGSPRSGHWTVELSDMELPSLSPYSIKYTGYYLKSGQLYLNLDGTLERDQLAGDNHIRLNRLEVDPVDQTQVEKFQEQLSMPLGTAVAVLQDDNDNIDLDVPISGSLQDPEFDYQSVINRVVGKGVKQGVMSYLVQALQPYGALITLTQSAIKASRTGAFISLEPIGFEPGSDQPVAAAADYLDQLAQLLNERAALRLNLCGLTVAADRTLVQQALDEANAARDEPLEPDALAVAVDARLTEIAENRAAAVKLHLQQRVPAEQLFLCYPQIDQPGEPRVEPAL